jgi:hypothetical protein
MGQALLNLQEPLNLLGPRLKPPLGLLGLELKELHPHGR